MNRTALFRGTALLLAGLACLGIVMASASGGGQVAEPEAIALLPAEAVSPARDIGPRAGRILGEMSKFLGSEDEFTFHAEICYDALLGSGQKVQYGGAVDVSVRRPGQLRAEYRGDERQSSAILDGGTFTAHNLAANVYTVMEVPPEIDAAIDQVFAEYGFSVPIADFLYADVYQMLTESVEKGFLLGRHAVDGVLCHHLVFSQEAIDWQIWIEDGPRPVPRKFVITYKDEEGSPQYTARFTRWDFEPHFADSYFRFHPPADADQIEILPVEEVEMEVKP